MQHLGEFLKAEREKKGIRLSDISNVTKIPIHNLKLLEEGNWKALPAKPFVKGFLTAYCKYIGLNSTQIYQRYLEESGQYSPITDSSPAPASSPSSEISKSPLKEVRAIPRVVDLKPIFISFFGVIFLVASIWLIQLGKQNSESETNVIASVSPMEQPIAAQQEPINQPPEVASREIANSQETTPVTAPPQESAAPSSDNLGHEIEVNPAELTWVKVVIDDAPPVNLRLNPQEKKKFSAKDKIKVVLGNASGSEVIHNGQKNEGKTYSGTIKYYIFPLGAKFPQDKPRQISNESAPQQDSDISQEAISESSEQ